MTAILKFYSFSCYVWHFFLTGEVNVKGVNTRRIQVVGKSKRQTNLESCSLRWMNEPTSIAVLKSFSSSPQCSTRRISVETGIVTKFKFLSSYWGMWVKFTECDIHNLDKNFRFPNDFTDEAFYPNGEVNK